MLSNHLGKTTLSPIINYANQTYAHADALIAVSETYKVKRVINHLDNQYKEVFTLEQIILILETNRSDQKKIIATYIGTMAGS